MDFNEVAKELGKRGGDKTKERYGIDYYKAIASKPRKKRVPKPVFMDEYLDKLNKNK